MNQLEDLALIHDGAEGAADQTLAAGHALVVVDLGPAVFVGADGIHAAGGFTGPLQLDDGMIGAGVHTFAALDALVGIDDGLAVLEGHGALGADLLAGAAQAALADIGDPNLLGGAGVAGIVDDVDQRGIVVFFRNGAFIDALGQGAVLMDRAQGQTHGQTNALTGDGTLQEDGLTVGGHFAGNNIIRNIRDLTTVIAAFIGQLGDLGKDFFSDFCNKRIITAHDYLSFETQIPYYYTAILEK